ncbi:MAG TPA: hypothetical protein VLW85_05515 [Myxococcales bacterium]|nr:hypothetical protein [Myxococcales bacterium]
MAEAAPINPRRQLVLHVMLSVLVSVLVFVAISYKVILPQLVQHEKRIRDLEAAVAQLQQEAEEEQPPAPQEQPPAAPAPAVDKK